MAKDPLRTKFCEILGIEFPIIAFTHCKDVAVSVINSGGFAVLGEAMHLPEQISAKYDGPAPKSGHDLHNWGGLVPGTHYVAREEFTGTLTVTTSTATPLGVGC